MAAGGKADGHGMGWLTVTGALNGALAVALGAFAAHGLEGRVPEADLATFETAARYHLVHALALVAAGILAALGAGRAVKVAGALFLAGIVLFSGSLYVLGITGSRALVMLAPAGGLCLVAGWTSLAVGARLSPKRP